MKRPGRWRRAWAGLMWGLSPGLVLAMAGAQAVDAWRVQHVHVNTERGDRLLYQVDDPRLVGRSIRFLPDRIDSDLPDATDCPAPAMQITRTTLNTLLDQSLLPALPGQDAAQDFGLGIPGQSEVQVRWISCQQGSWGPMLSNTPQRTWTPAERRRNWLVELPDGTARLRWYGNTVLSLQPASAREPIRPSFACAKARQPAERAICADARLASFDLSLAQAWRVAQEACDQVPACLSELKRTQSKWVAQRNRCQQNATCLRLAMRQRLNALMTPPP